MFNDVLDGKKKNIFAIKKSVFQSPKNRIFPKRLTHAFGQKIIIFFLYLFSVKIRLEKFLNNFLDKKETFFSHKKFKN